MLGHDAQAPPCRAARRQGDRRRRHRRSACRAGARDRSARRSNPACARCRSPPASSPPRARRGAQGVVEACWATSPHPDLADVYASVKPDETHEERVKRLVNLAHLNRDHFERVLEAEEAVHDKDWSAARRILAPLADDHASARLCPDGRDRGRENADARLRTSGSPAARAGSRCRMALQMRMRRRTTGPRSATPARASTRCNGARPRAGIRLPSVRAIHGRDPVDRHPHSKPAQWLPARSSLPPAPDDPGPGPTSKSHSKRLSWPRLRGHTGDTRADANRCTSDAKLPLDGPQDLSWMARFAGHQ